MNKVEILRKLKIGDEISASNMIVKQYKEIEKLHSIIKEVREYIKKEAMYSNEWKSCCDDLYCKDCDKVLQILDKVEENK